MKVCVVDMRRQFPHPELREAKTFSLEKAYTGSFCVAGRIRMSSSQRDQTTDPTDVI